MYKGISDLAYEFASETIQSRIKECCGALNTLCFNFINKYTIQNLYELYTKTLLCPVQEISEAAFKCLQYIEEQQYNFLPGIIVSFIIYS